MRKPKKDSNTLVSYSDETLRKRLILLLSSRNEPLSISDILFELGLDRAWEKEIYRALSHVAKTIWRSSGGKQMLYMIPPSCRNCGYVFKDLDKPRKPSKCPKCHGQRVDEPKFIILER